MWPFSMYHYDISLSGKTLDGDPIYPCGHDKSNQMRMNKFTACEVFQIAVSEQGGVQLRLSPLVWVMTRHPVCAKPFGEQTFAS